MTQTLVVIGGGIAGLSCAYSAHERLIASSADVRVLLLEAGSELGGRVRTRESAGHIFEEGPNAYIRPSAELSSLIERSGVEILTADDSAKRRFLCKGGELHELSTHPLKLLKSSFLSTTAKLRAAAEPTIGARRSEHGNHASEGWGDESVDAFFTRRFGPKMAATFAAPLVSGIYAGDPKRLSLASCFPRLADMEARHGSIIKGMMALRKEGVKIPMMQAPAQGMQSIPRALGANAPFEIRTSVSVTGVTPSDTSWSLSLSSGEELRAEALCVATPNRHAASLLSASLPSVSAPIAKIRSPHLAVVSLIYSKEQAGSAPRGFGALHVHDGASSLLGVIHESHVFPARSVDGSLHMRVMMGGATRPDMADLADAELAALATEELQRLHGFAGEPAHAHVTRWPEAIPQYELGHSRLIQDARAALESSVAPPLALAGNYLTGVSLSDTATSGAEAAKTLCDRLCP